MRIAFVVFLIFFGAMVCGTASADAVFYVGTGAGCTHATIQQALDAADNANGTTFVRITRTLTYTQQNLVIHGKNVVLTGGYADCQQSVEDDVHAAIGGIDSTSRPVILIDGTTDSVGLYKLDITGNTNEDVNALPGFGFGGAIAVWGGPHRLVEIGESSLYGNTADFGGGLYVRNDVSQDRADVVVLLGANVTVASNRAQISGGGVWCSNATVMMTRPGSTISANIAQSGAGGGVRAQRCALNIASGGLGLGAVSLNSAGTDGGGMSLTSSQVKLYTTDAFAPLLLWTNNAQGKGGAIAMDGGSRVRAWQTVIEANSGRSGGGAVSIDEAGAGGASSSFEMRGDLVGAPRISGTIENVAELCHPSVRCNLIDWNSAIGLDGTRFHGAAILAASAGDGDNDNLTSLDYTLRGTEVFGNSGRSLIASTGDFAFGTLRGVALVGNSATNYLIELAAPSSSAFGVYSSTIAGNSAAGDRTIHRDFVIGLQFQSSIHWQPGKQIQRGAGVFSGDIDYVIANDLSNVASSTHNLETDPLFVDPSAQNFHLQLASPAVDYVPENGDPAAGTPFRVVDLESVPDEFGPQDAGAYERQDACGDDSILCDGFDP